MVQAGRPTVRAPDLAFIAGDRGRAASDHPGFVEGAPELAVEVVSPSDTTGEVHAKALMWLEAGTVLVLVLDPAKRTADAYRTPDDIRTLGIDDTLDAPDVVPGWRLPLADLFRA